MASQYLLLLVQHGFLKPNPDTRMDTALGDGVAPLGFAFVLQEHHINALQKAYDLNAVSYTHLTLPTKRIV